MVKGNNIEKTRLKLRVGTERATHAFIHNKLWRKYWGFCQKHHINYYNFMALGKAIEKIQKYRFEDYDLYAIGQSHLDAAWHWTKLSTIRRAILTAQQSIDHFKKYPFYTFSQTTPQYYEWIKKLRPELFKQIQEYEKKGRWEIVGGMWVEPDANLPSGEALVRQRLYGQLFYLENFGKFAKIECLEDTFGFNAQLPQILVKSGCEAFWTTKLTWNEYTEFPFANFFWRGLDGSEIFTHMFLFNFLLILNLGLYKRTGRKVKERGMVFDSSQTLDEINSHKIDDRVRACGIFYGLGDGGMGPLTEEVDLFQNIGKAGLLKFCTTQQYFDILRKECGEKIPVWDDELYLELHRGCYSSQANTKRLNRECEVNLRNCELLLTLFALFYNNFKFPFDSIKKMWKNLCFNQFHDILPGSSEQDVYYEQEKEMEEIIEKTTNLMSISFQFMLKSYLQKQNDLKNINDYIIVINSLSWTRDGIITLPGKRREFYIVKNLPPLSFRVINIKNELKLKEEGNKKTDLKLDNRQKAINIENSKLSLTINKISGKITSIISKERKRELIRKGDGIGFHVYKEKRTRYPAWEIFKNYTIYPVKKGIVKGIKIEKDDESIKSIKIIYRFKKSYLIQNISLRSDSETIEFRTEIDAYNKYLLFKTRFPLDITTNTLNCEIPYGYYKRKIIPSSEMEKGKWEFPAQKYVDMSEESEDFGVTLINNSKYGFSATKKGLYLTLLHTPIRPTSTMYSILDLVPKKERTKYVDIGYHSIDYALWIHNGNFIQSKAWQKGYEYNYPLLCEKYKEDRPISSEFRDIEINERFKTNFQKEMPMVTISNPNVILEVIKFPERIILEMYEKEFQCEKKNIQLILRLFETTGSSQATEIEFSNVLRINKAIETDLLEISDTKTVPIKIKDHKKLLLSFSKFEIKTIKICLSI